MKLVPSEEYEKCVSLAKASMLEYYVPCGLEWDDDERLKAYSSCELFEIETDRTVGFLLVRETGEEFYIADIQIEEEHRNRGIGSEVLSQAKRMAHERGFSVVKLKVFKNSPALSLYLRGGFIIAAEEDHVSIMESST